MSQTPTPANSWFIIRFTDPSVLTSHDILYMNNPTESLQTASSTLEHTLHQRFDRMGDLDSGDSFRISRLAVVSTDNADLQITLLQLVTFLRDLPQAPSATKPDLWGLGGNEVVVTFEYVEVFD